MEYTCRFDSPLGDILLASDGESLTGLWFAGQKYFAAGLSPAHRDASLPVFDQTRRWLDVYFQGRDPGFTPALHLGGTMFRQAVWQLLLAIPYGQTVTYGGLADTLSQQRGGLRVSARAVGGAVGHNPVSLIVPCHRVMGAGGALTGYAGGVEKKRQLLQLEGISLNPPCNR